MARGGEHEGAAGDQPETQSAEYIAELSGELAKLARRSRLDLLAHLLDIASLEARSAAGPERPLRHVGANQRAGTIGG